MSRMLLNKGSRVCFSINYDDLRHYIVADISRKIRMFFQRTIHRTSYYGCLYKHITNIAKQKEAMHTFTFKHLNKYKVSRSVIEFL